MIITQTPLRVSFAGGGSDLPAFYRRFGGAVVSTAIDKFVYINVNKKFDQGIRVSYSRTEEVDSVERVDHPIVRAALGKLKITGGLEITSIADIPSRGTGLGSSSSFTVGLLLGLHAFESRYVSPGDLAEESCHVEIDLCGEPIGKQDQYAAAFGGLNYIRFEPDDSVIVEPILMAHDELCQLEDSLITFYTGVTRLASSILSDQSKQSESDKGTQELLSRMTALAHTLRDELNQGHVAALGEILDEGWRLKREVHPAVSSSVIDDWYGAARRAGACGGKLLGAGGGGFLLFFAPRDRHDAIEKAVGLRRVDLRLERGGSRVLLYHNPAPRSSR
ncbi:MAG TPA: galactokinase [Bryobacteraceae bacterium]|jgi:D-glycero-alpha-D-manno-heptose-7-phosphate kinase|nr:galactokinase [Bryobacteraceae bacterium]